MIGRGKQKGSTAASGEQSWHQLAGPKKKRLNSPQAKKRRRTQLLKIASVFACLILVGALIAWAIVSFKNREESIQLATPSKPIEEVRFVTDGVLPNHWLGSVIELNKGMTMMEIDIHGIKQRLEAQGQVRSASVEREFPSALKITVTEREPALRMRVTTPDGTTEDRIVARDGTLYKGMGYSKSMLRTLPYLSPYQNADGTIEPLLGIDTVAELLDVTRRMQPDFMKTWQIVFLKNFSGDLELPGQVIEVQTTMIPRLIFGLNSDFDQQLDRLAVILNYVQSRGNPAIKRIDLSLLDSAAVQFESGRISTF